MKHNHPLFLLVLAAITSFVGGRGVLSWGFIGWTIAFYLILAFLFTSIVEDFHIKLEQINPSLDQPVKPKNCTHASDCTCFQAEKCLHVADDACYQVDIEDHEKLMQEHEELEEAYARLEVDRNALSRQNIAWRMECDRTRAALQVSRGEVNDLADELARCKQQTPQSLYLTPSETTTQQDSGWGRRRNSTFSDQNERGCMYAVVNADSHNTCQPVARRSISEEPGQHQSRYCPGGSDSQIQAQSEHFNEEPFPQNWNADSGLGISLNGFQV